MDFFTAQLTYCRPLLWPWAQVWVSGALSIFWKVTARTTPHPMLMCGKVTSKDFDRQPPAIP